MSGATRDYESAERRMSFNLKTTNGSIRFDYERSHARVSKPRTT